MSCICSWKNVDGVLTAATDYGVLTMSYIAQELELPGINYEAAKRIRNKAAVRKCLFDAKLMIQDILMRYIM